MGIFFEFSEGYTILPASLHLWHSFVLRMKPLWVCSEGHTHPLQLSRLNEDPECISGDIPPSDLTAFSHMMRSRLEMASREDLGRLPQLDCQHILRNVNPNRF